MNSKLVRIGEILLVTMVLSCQLFGQMDDALLSWSPSTGYSSFGPASIQSGYMNMWQDGTCLADLHTVGASVVEAWACSQGQTATVSGAAGLLYGYDQYQCMSYQNGVYANGKVTIPNVPTPANQEFAEDNCNGFRDSSGGPHPWPCGSGQGQGTTG